MKKSIIIIYLEEFKTLKTWSDTRIKANSIKRLDFTTVFVWIETFTYGYSITAALFVEALADLVNKKPNNSIGLLKILCILNKCDLAKFFKLAEIQEEF